MAKSSTVVEFKSTDPVDPAAEETPKLVIAFGRGGTGKSTVLSEVLYRARNRGRPVIPADFDSQSKTLRSLFPDAVVPVSDEMPDVKEQFMDLLNRMSLERKSAVVDFGGGDQFMREFAKDMGVVKYCARKDINPVAVYVLSPDIENLRHCLSVFESGHFMPGRMLVILNEGVIREGKTVKGAFDATLRDPGFARMVEAGAKVMLMTKLPIMEAVQGVPDGSGSVVGAKDLYAAATGSCDNPLEPVQEFILGEWLEELEAKRKKLGVAEWLP